MSDVNTNKFGGALLFILGEFAAAEEEMIEDGGMEVFGEDDQGREGSCEVSINELAKAASDEIIHLSDQLAKANEIISACWLIVGNDVDSKSTLPEHVNALNERVKELEKELKESDDDLCFTQQQSSNYENALEQVQAIFVDSDACPLFEPFNAKNLSYWLNKFAIEQKIDALDELEYGLTWFGDAGCLAVTSEYISNRMEQLRKEQEQ